MAKDLSSFGPTHPAFYHEFEKRYKAVESRNKNVTQEMTKKEIEEILDFAVQYGTYNVLYETICLLENRGESIFEYLYFCISGYSEEGFITRQEKWRMIVKTLKMYKKMNRKQILREVHSKAVEYGDVKTADVLVRKIVKAEENFLTSPQGIIFINFITFTLGLLLSSPSQSTAHSSRPESFHNQQSEGFRPEMTYG